MPQIVLATLNAKYIHAAFGLRYLMANLGALQCSACLAEFDINRRPLEIAEALLARNPRILALGVYIWNVAQTALVIGTVKRVRPDITVVLGGHEVSYETQQQPIVQLADYVICGEADLKFAELCRNLLSGRTPAGKILTANPPDFSQLALPYDLYDEQDIAHRVIYVEASRGCPFSCEFCLSSLEIPVRQVPIPVLLEQLQRLFDRGVQQFKFVDRTFNLNLNVSQTLLEFFLERHQPGRFYHFEMIPDRLPAGLRELIARFPPGSLQFEVGVQTFNPQVAELDQPAPKLRAARGELALSAGPDRRARACGPDCGFAGREPGQLGGEHAGAVRRRLEDIAYYLARSGRREAAGWAAAAAARLRDGADLKRIPFFQALIRAQLGAMMAEQQEHAREEPRLIMTPAEAMRAQQHRRVRSGAEFDAERNFDDRGKTACAVSACST